MKNIPEEVIIKAAQGDMEAFEAIYKDTSSYVYTLSYRVTGNREDAEEVTQDVFIKVFKNLSKFKFKSSFKTWLYRIATNTAINMYRKRSKERGKNMPFDERIEVKEGKEGVVEALEKKDIEAKVKLLLGELPPKQRECVILKDIQGLKYFEIAKILKININTVRSRLKRARQKLISRSKKRECLS